MRVYWCLGWYLTTGTSYLSPLMQLQVIFGLLGMSQYRALLGCSAFLLRFVLGLSCYYSSILLPAWHYTYLAISSYSLVYVETLQLFQIAWCVAIRCIRGDYAVIAFKHSVTYYNDCQFALVQYVMLTVLMQHSLAYVTRCTVSFEDMLSFVVTVRFMLCFGPLLVSLALVLCQ